MNEKTRSILDAMASTKEIMDTMADTIDGYRKRFEDIHRLAGAAISKMPDGETGLFGKSHMIEIQRKCNEVLKGEAD